MINAIKPIYSIAFKRWNQNDDNCYYSQIKMIRHLANVSMSNTYDYYIRIRPDSVIPNIYEIKIPSPYFSSYICGSYICGSYICSSRKFDARANDQFFIMSKKTDSKFTL